MTHNNDKRSFSALTAASGDRSDRRRTMCGKRKRSYRSTVRTGQAKAFGARLQPAPEPVTLGAHVSSRGRPPRRDHGIKTHEPDIRTNVRSAYIFAISLGIALGATQHISADRLYVAGVSW